MKWVTRERPKVDWIACPWLIQRFVDPDAEFLYIWWARCAVIAIIAIAAYKLARSTNKTDPLLWGIFVVLASATAVLQGRAR